MTPGREPIESARQSSSDCSTEDMTTATQANALEIPEIANQEVLGEWLIPKGECLLVSFGPHTVADKDGRAIVKEDLAVIEADEQPGVGPSAHRATTAAPQ